MSFSSDLSTRFFSPMASKTISPFLFHLFSVFMHFCCAFGDIFKPKGIWDFWCFKPLLSNLINGFFLWDTIKLILVIQFDRFDVLGEIWISGAWKYPNWRFCSIRFNLMKLASWIDSYDHYIVLSILISDQLVKPSFRPSKRHNCPHQKSFHDWWVTVVRWLFVPFS